MMYDIVHKHKQSNMSILAAWVLYFVVILSLTGYSVVKLLVS